MAQGPLQVDGIQIAGSLTITQDATTGGLKFTDGTGSLLLKQAANLTSNPGTFVVGAGQGSTHTSIQAALSAVPADASITNPYLILVSPGTYTENISWIRDGVTLQALGQVVVQPASVGSVITLTGSVSTTPRTATLRGLTIVQPHNGQACVTLTGGAGSTLGSQTILIEDCQFKPSGIGGMTVSGTTFNTLVMRRCRADGVPSSTTMALSQCGSLDVQGGTLPASQVDLSSSGSLPSLGATGPYRFTSCDAIGNFQSTLQGAGSLVFQSSTVGNLTLNGNRTLQVRGCALGTLTLNDTSAASLVGTTRGSATGTGTLQEDRLIGSTAFVSTDQVVVTFPVARLSSSFLVLFDAGPQGPPWAESKTVNGFTLQFSSPVTTTVDWVVIT